ncbi:MAG: WXG100 family type VII secretion target, partial [Clostridia bacterium]|nr:WXG100 family type VII secretion target [Clostridia bacterium]
DCYNQAIEQLRAAAEALASKWEGEGRDAFYENQMRAFRHYYSLRDICRAIADKIEEARSRYSEALDHLKQLM